jgi:hypothetical protein
MSTLVIKLKKRNRSKIVIMINHRIEYFKLSNTYVWIWTFLLLRSAGMSTTAKELFVYYIKCSCICKRWTVYLGEQGHNKVYSSESTTAVELDERTIVLPYVLPRLTTAGLLFELLVLFHRDELWLGNGVKYVEYSSKETAK